LDTGNQDAKQALQQLAPQQLTAPAAVQPAPAQIAQRQSAPLCKPEQSESAASVPPFKDLFQVAAPVVAPAPSAVPAQNLSGQQTPEPACSPEELYREALQLANTGKPDEAIRVLEKLLQQDSRHAAAQNDLGVLYQKIGEPVKSRQHHEEAARLQPANKIFQKNLADLLFVEFNELEEALGIYVRLQAKSPQDIEILKAIATVCQAVGNQPDARFFLERVLALQPWDRDAQGMLKAMEEAGKAGA